MLTPDALDSLLCCVERRVKRSRARWRGLFGALCDMRDAVDELFGSTESGLPKQTPGRLLGLAALCVIAAENVGDELEAQAKLLEVQGNGKG